MDVGSPLKSRDLRTNRSENAHTINTPKHIHINSINILFSTFPFLLDPDASDNDRFNDSIDIFL